MANMAFTMCCGITLVTTGYASDIIGYGLNTEIVYYVFCILFGKGKMVRQLNIWKPMGMLIIVHFGCCFDQ